jgi:hypothetical protein
MTAQQQFGLMRPGRSRLHDDPHYRLGHTAAASIGRSWQHYLAAGVVEERGHAIASSG